MALNVAFRWNVPQVSVANAEQASRLQGVKDLAAGIGAAAERNYQRKEQARRNAIEDEDRKRRMEEEDRRKQAYGEAADLIRKREAAMKGLQARRDELAAEIAKLEDELKYGG